MAGISDNKSNPSKKSDAIAQVSLSSCEILSALKFAAGKHRNQRRKDKEHSPYINHPIDVAECLWRIGEVRELAVLMAAVLHDTVEDTDTTFEELEGLFGREVSALVKEVTDDKSLPKATRKKLQIEHAPHISSGAKAIKLADKISNVTDIGRSPPADWSMDRLVEYLDWTEKVVTGLRGVNAGLERRYDEALKEARQRLSTIDGDLGIERT